MDDEVKFIELTEAKLREFMPDDAKRYHEEYSYSEPGIVVCINASGARRIVESTIVRPQRDRGALVVSGQISLVMKEALNTAKAVANNILRGTEIEHAIDDNIIHINFPKQNVKKVTNCLQGVSHS